MVALLKYTGGVPYYVKGLTPGKAYMCQNKEKNKNKMFAYDHLAKCLIS